MQSLRESHEGHVAEEVVAEFEKSLLEIRRIVPRVICARPGFEDVGVAEVEEIVGDADRLRRGLEKVEQACGGIPFLW